MIRVNEPSYVSHERWSSEHAANEITVGTSALVLRKHHPSQGKRDTGDMQTWGDDGATRLSMLGGMLTNMGNRERVDLLCDRRLEIPEGGRGVGSGVKGSWMKAAFRRTVTFCNEFVRRRPLEYQGTNTELQ